jgi:alpha-glucosidase
MIPLLNELRALLDTYPERYAVGETYLATPQKTVSYCGPDKLHAAFSFDFTSAELIYPWNPRWIMQQIARREETFNAAGIWPTTVMSNHDLPRAASRYAKGEDDAQAKIAMTLLLTLRGTPFLYYGEEIGMRDIHLRRNEILDPPGKHYWPIYKGRDGCRSPMQWNDTAYAGFSTARPWLPLNSNYVHRNVLAQRADSDSIFNFTKKLLALRKEIPALRRGDFAPLETPRGLLAYLRWTEEQSVLVVVNFSARDRKYIPPDGHWRVIFTNAKNLQDTSSNLAPHEARLLVGEL